jgi:hypothetical protein
MAPSFEAPKKEEEPLLDEITKELSTMKWPVKRPMRDGTRGNVTAHEDTEIRAFALGKVRRYDLPLELVTSQYNKKFPYLLELLRRLVRLHNPGFRYNAIQLNANVQTSPHYDKNNVGRSYCLAVGKYTGGGLTLYADGGDVPTEVYRNKRKWVLYDGKRVKHGSAPVTSGTRFAIIYFTNEPKSKRSRRSKRS